MRQMQDFRGRISRQKIGRAGDVLGVDLQGPVLWLHRPLGVVIVASQKVDLSVGTISPNRPAAPSPAGRISSDRLQNAFQAIAER